MPPMPNPPSQTTLTVSQAAAALGRSDKSIRRLIERGELRAVKQKTQTGQEWRIPVEDVSALGGQVTDTDGQVTDTDGQVTDTDGHQVTDTDGQVTDTDGQVTTFALTQVEARLARIEGVLAGQLMSQLSAEVSAVSMSLSAIVDQMKAQQEETQRQAQAAQEREEKLLYELQSLRDMMGRTWWDKLFRKGRKSE